MMKNIGIIAKNIPKAHRVARELAKWLAARKHTVFIDSVTAAAIDASGHDREKIPQLVDMVIVLGGDGTLLSAARVVCDAKRNVPILGVNLGTLGFLTAVTLHELYDNLKNVLTGKIKAEERMMLIASVIRRGKRLSRYTVLNDAVINKGTLARMVKLQVSVNEGHLTSIKADGLILSTPTGSTAYSLSAGGPIIHPEIHCFVLTPICPHTLTNRPIALPDSSVVTVQLVSRSEDVALTLDGQVMCPLRYHDIVEVRKAVYRLKLIRHAEKSYYEILRTKLNWGN